MAFIIYKESGADVGHIVVHVVSNYRGHRGLDDFYQFGQLDLGFERLGKENHPDTEQNHNSS